MSTFEYPASWTQADRDALEALFTRATAEGLWFHHGGLSGPISLSPAELRAHQAKGSLIWGAVNWELRKPATFLDEIDRKIASISEERRSVERRIAEMAPA